MYRKLLAAGLIVLLTCLVYWQVYAFDYVEWDDPALVVMNPAIEGFTPRNLAWAFTTNHTYNWHPLTWMSYMLDVQLFGRQPGAFHIVNAVLHACSGLLLLLLIWEMGGQLWKGVFIAAVFAVHPLHVESVAWISERKDVLSILFGLAAMLAYVRYVKRPRRRWLWYALAVLAFALSLLAKQTLVTLPFLLLLLDWWPLERRKGREHLAEATDAPTEDDRPSVGENGPARWSWLVVEKLPFFMLSLAFCVIVYEAQRPGEDVADYAVYPLWVRCANAVLAYGLYLIKSVWPYGLAAFYPHPGAGISLWAVAASATVLVGITGVAIAFRKQCPALLVGWLWYLGTLVPMIGLIQVGEQQMADRYMYFPLIGLTISVAWLVPSVMPQGALRSQVLPFATTLLVCVLALAAYVQASLWQNSTTLFQHMVDVTRDNYVAHNLLGNALWAEGQQDAALEQYERAVALNPRFADAHHNLARRSRELKDLGKALFHFQVALEVNPDDPELLTEYGELLLMLGRLDEALPKLQRAVELAPYFAQAHNNLGQGLVASGKYKEALAEFSKALLIDPQYVAANCNAAMVLITTDRADETDLFVDAALSASPGDPLVRNVAVRAYLEWGRKLASQGEHRQAVSKFALAVPLASSPADAYSSHLLMAQSLATWDPTAARRQFEQAIELAPTSAEARVGLGKLLLAEGQREAALEQLREAVRLSPDDESAQEALRAAEEPVQDDAP